MKVLVIGSGGREHAIVWKLSQSKKVSGIFVAPGNPGTAALAQNVPINATDIKKLLSFAKKEKIDCTIVGPEAPLVMGIVDLFEKHHQKIFGPSKNGARIEGSKVWAKKLMKKYNIPTAGFVVFSEYLAAKKYLQTAKYPCVVKADGPALGKGVAVCANKTEAQKFLSQIMMDRIFGPSGNKIIIEEVLSGPEISFMIATDGREFISLLPSQDHKKVSDGDKGPNTGGMGAYAPVPFVSRKMITEIEKKIVRPTLNALALENSLYKGILYPGLILTKEGPKVLEFNCRMGDPETQPLLSLLETDLMDIVTSVLKGNVMKSLTWKKAFAVCIVLTAKGYPGKYQKGVEIKGLKKTSGKKNIHIFHSGTSTKNDQIVTTGGRVLGVIGVNSSLIKAMDMAYASIGKKAIWFSGMHYRKDIGRKGVAKYDNTQI